MFQSQAHADTLWFEKMMWRQGLEPVVGLDEAGRGCLAGPVVAAAVILRDKSPIKGVTDSKLLSPLRRQQLAELIKSEALAWSVAQVEASQIDKINILQASLQAMAMAVETLSTRPAVLLVDGNQSIPHPLPQKTVIKGDLRSASIAAASILAKVHRDRLMEEYDSRFPGYGFKSHKGYGTKAHLEAIRSLGPCPIHRLSFKGVKG